MPRCRNRVRPRREACCWALRSRIPPAASRAACAGSAARGNWFWSGAERNGLKPQVGAFSLVIGPTYGLTCLRLCMQSHDVGFVSIVRIDTCSCLSWAGTTNVVSVVGGQIQVVQSSFGCVVRLHAQRCPVARRLVRSTTARAVNSVVTHTSLLAN
jgi:hypothetical protein